MPFGKLNPAVKTAISPGAIALQGSAACPCPCPPLTFPAQGQGFSGVARVALVMDLIFGEAAHFLSIQKRGNRLPPIFGDSNICSCSHHRPW